MLGLKSPIVVHPLQRHRHATHEAGFEVECVWCRKEMPVPQLESLGGVTGGDIFAFSGALHVIRILHVGIKGIVALVAPERDGPLIPWAHHGTKHPWRVPILSFVNVDIAAVHEFVHKRNVLYASLCHIKCSLGCDFAL